MIDPNRRVTVRFPTPFLSIVRLGDVVGMDSPFGRVKGVVMGVYRAPADELLPAGVMIEVAPLVDA